MCYGQVPNVNINLLIGLIWDIVAWEVNEEPMSIYEKKKSSVHVLSLSLSLLQTGQEGSSPRPTPTRIPVSKGMKAGKPVVTAPGAGNVTKFEPRAETQSMKIELKKSSASSSASLGGGQGWWRWLRGYVLQVFCYHGSQPPVCVVAHVCPY